MNGGELLCSGAFPGGELEMALRRDLRKGISTPLESDSDTTRE